MSHPPKPKDLANELHDVKTKWRAIGVQLELPQATLKSIGYANPSDANQAFIELMNEWLAHESDPSWEAIIDALRSRSVGENALASRLEDKYCPGRLAGRFLAGGGRGSVKFTFFLL